MAGTEILSLVKPTEEADEKRCDISDGGALRGIRTGLRSQARGDSDGKGLCAGFSLRVHEGVEKADQQGMRDCMCESRVCAGDSGGRRDDLLADCGNHALERAKCQVAAVCWGKSNGGREDL